MVIANDHYQSIWNCLFVSNQGAFNVSHVSGRSAFNWANAQIGLGLVWSVGLGLGL